jgi:hypothetical protein
MDVSTKTSPSFWQLKEAHEMNGKLAVLCAALLALSVVGFSSHDASAESLPEGTVLTTFDSLIFGVGLGFDGQFLYVPMGIDANQLALFDTGGTPLGTLDLTCTIGNLSYDATRNVFWAGNIAIEGSSAPIYTIDPDTGACTFQFDAYQVMIDNGACGSFSCFRPFDGIDYDERDDTLRISPDGSTIIYNFNLDGTLASSFGPINTTVECGFDFSSGIATGQSEILYSATNGCLEVFKWNKDTGEKLDHFTITGRRNEAMECDNVTFIDTENDAIWIKDLDGPVQAFAVPMNTCEIIPELTVDFDIKPGSCPNPFKLGKAGVVPVAILGSETLDVADIDPTTVELSGPGGTAAPLRWSVEDVAAPDEFPEPELRDDCGTDGPDGFDDLTLKFDAAEVAEVLGPVSDRDVVILTISAETTEGALISGVDAVWIRGDSEGNVENSAQASEATTITPSLHCSAAPIREGNAPLFLLLGLVGLAIRRLRLN